MNKHILLVMKWLNDECSVTLQELIDNRDAAYAAYAAADAADADAAEKWVSKYLERSGENKQDYIDALKPTTPIYTQAMCDAGIAPSVGMGCIVFMSSTSKSGEAGIVEFKNEQGFLFRYKENNLCDYYSLDDGSHFKPLTPPIELIDGKAYQFTCHSGDEVVGIYSAVHLSFDNYGRKFFESTISDIQQLTVKGEE